MSNVIAELEKFVLEIWLRHVEATDAPDTTYQHNYLGGGE